MKRVLAIVGFMLLSTPAAAFAEQGLSLSVAAGPAHDVAGDASAVGSAGVVRLGWRWSSGFALMATAVPVIDVPDGASPSHAFGGGIRQSFRIGAYEPYLEASLVAADGPAALLGGGIAWRFAPEFHVGLFADALIADGTRTLMEGLELVRFF